jgi:tRNA/rRNA methyltransferase
MVVSFFEFLEDRLERSGFFRPPDKGPVMRRNLRNIFHRIGMTEQDVRTLRGAIVRLVEGPRAAPQTRRRRQQQKRDEGEGG